MSKTILAKNMNHSVLTVKAVDILAEVGYYTGPYPAERIWRDVKLCEIGEGTSEIQRLVISRDLLKSVKEA